MLLVRERILRDPELSPGRSERIFAMVDEATFDKGGRGTRSIHQRNLMIMQQFIEVQFPSPPMRERNCLSAEGAHKSVLRYVEYGDEPVDLQADGHLCLRVDQIKRLRTFIHVLPIGNLYVRSNLQIRPMACALSWRVS